MFVSLVYAEDNASDIFAPEQEDFKVVPKITGYIKEIFEDGSILIEADEYHKEPYAEIRLDIKEAKLVDMTGKKRITNEDIKVGNSVTAYYSEKVTKSIPPQSTASAILLNALDEDAATLYMTVKEETRRGDDFICYLNEEGSMIVSFAEGLDFTTIDGEKLSYKDIMIGDEILVWYDIVLTSYPGQTGADKAVLVDRKDKAVQTVEIAEDGTIKLFDKTFNVGNMIIDENIIRLPLRNFFENLGYEVGWNDQFKTISLIKGEETISVSPAYNYYEINGERITVTDGFLIVNGSTYASLDFYERLFNIKFEIK